MGKFSKQFLILVISVSLVFVPFCTHALAQEPGQQDDLDAGKMTVDFLVVRPLAIVSTVVGTAIFIVSIPFSALGRNVKPAANALVVEPFQFTFTRPLGEL